MDTQFDVIRGSLERTRDLTGNVHLLPCSVDANGRANVSKYFKPIVKKEKDAQKSLYTPFEEQPSVDIADGVLTAPFRGRKLRGETLKVPDGYIGVVLTDDSGGPRNHEGKSWTPASKFSEMTYWNLETIPSEDDAIRKAFKWFELANALHSPSSSNDIRRSPRKSPMKDYSGMESPRKKGRAS